MEMTNILSLFEESKKFVAGEVLIHEGEENRDLYILSKGVLEVSVQDESKKVIVSEIVSPEILGEISFLNREPENSNCLCENGCRNIYTELRESKTGDI